MTEAFLQALWRSAAVGVVLLPVSVMISSKRDRALASVLGAFAMLSGALLWWIPAIQAPMLKSAVLRGNTLLAGLLLLAAVVLGTTGLAKWCEKRSAARWSGIALLLVPLLALDGIELAEQLRLIAFLKGGSAPYAVALIVLAATFASCVPLASLLRRAGAERFLAPWSLLLFVTAARAGFEPFIITALEGAIARVMHDLVHVVIVLILLPDHVYITGWLWTFLGLPFMKSTGTVLNISVFFGVTGYLVIRAYFAALPVYPGVKAPERRRRWAEERAARRRASVPAYIAIVLFATFTVRAATFAGSPIPPDRKQLVTWKAQAGGGTLGVIDPTVLEDGNLHVWTYDERGRSMRVLAVKKPDGSVAVCLDACLLCAPEGYAELGEDLFCLHCVTPIPIATVGEPGGCNPVPLDGVETQGGRLVFDIESALDLWEEVTQGR